MGENPMGEEGPMERPWSGYLGGDERDRHRETETQTNRDGA